MYSALTYPKKLAGIVGLSTYISISHILEKVELHWNSSNLDTIGPEENVLIGEVSLFQGLKSTTWGGRKYPV